MRATFRSLRIPSLPQQVSSAVAEERRSMEPATKSNDAATAATVLISGDQWRSERREGRRRTLAGAAGRGGQEEGPAHARLDLQSLAGVQARHWCRCTPSCRFRYAGLGMAMFSLGVCQFSETAVLLLLVSLRTSVLQNY